MEILILIIFLIFAYIKERKWYAPSFIFTLFWTVIVILAKIRLFGLYETSEKVFHIVTLGVVFFDIGNWIHNHRITLSKKYNTKHIDNALNWKMLNVLFYIGVIGISSVAITAIGYLMKGANLSTIRYSLSEEVFGNYFATVLYMFVAYPITYLYVILLGVCIVHVPEKLKTVLIRVIILCGLGLVVSGNQRTFYVLFVVIIFSFFIGREKIVLSAVVKKIIFISLFLTIIAVFLIRQFRGSTSLVQSISEYFSGCLVYFSRYLEDFSSDHTIIASSMQGLLRPVVNVLEKIGVNWDLFTLADNYQYRLQYACYYISPNTNYNFFSSCFAFFYNDLEWTGVIVYSFIYGWICKDAFIKYKTFKSAYSYGIFIFFISTILLGMNSFVFVRTEIAYGLVFFMIFSKFKKKTKKG